MIEDKLITKLKERLVELSSEALSSPSPDHSHYMKRVGQYQGLEEALKILHDLLGPDEDEG